MKTPLIVAIDSLIFRLILGTALTVTNLEEFCSMEFFDRITTKRVGDRTVIQFYRKDEKIKDRIHLWTAHLDDNPDTGLYRMSDISYELKSKS